MNCWFHLERAKEEVLATHFPGGTPMCQDCFGGKPLGWPDINVYSGEMPRPHAPNRGDLGDGTDPVIARRRKRQREYYWSDKRDIERRQRLRDREKGKQ